MVFDPHPKSHMGIYTKNPTMLHRMQLNVVALTIISPEQEAIAAPWVPWYYGTLR